MDLRKTGFVSKDCIRASTSRHQGSVPGDRHGRDDRELWAASGQAFSSPRFRLRAHTMGHLPVRWARPQAELQVSSGPSRDTAHREVGRRLSCSRCQDRRG